MKAFYFSTSPGLPEWPQQYWPPQQRFYQWAIVPRDLGEPIGTISVVEQDDRVGKAAIGALLSIEQNFYFVQWSILLQLSSPLGNSGPG